MRWLSAIAACSLGACGGGAERHEASGSGVDSVGAANTTGGESSEDASSGQTDGEDGADAADSTGGGTKLDVGYGTDTGVVDDTGDEGCAKVDFLFVVDNSESMFDEQQNLVASFPGFIETIEQTIDAQDYHVMVVSTDATYRASNVECGATECTCDFNPDCCFEVCADANLAPDRCNDQTCDVFLPAACEDVLGSGKLADPQANACGVDGDNRYMVDGQNDLSGTFECLAVVGDQGDNHERPMQAMLEAVGVLSAPGACNDGFVRDDAILVVTFISDEEDNGKSEGNPAAWRQGLIDAKGGNADAVVVLGLIGDPEQPDAVCPPYDPTTGDHAEPAPRLRQFVDSMEDRGFLGSICAPSFTPFFEAAVEVVDTACSEFEPEG